MLSKIKNFFPLLALFTPLVMFGQTLGSIGIKIIDLLEIVVPILMVLALIFFFIGLIKYIMSAGDEEAQSSGRRTMINGVIALFVMVAVWGLVNVLGNTFGIDPGEAAPNIDPIIPTDSSKATRTSTR